ncbi:hypothetical protein H6F77_01665 [Microcoleus sp. FACHB-831]|uniref:hypothetical protein n=1 Tax=Microcoleus sp. FACHB-831 TaxID=2692827 RepID=UPI0016870A42|nr:hypothetical protein [Microcoleus sp. FACHB-831]MBD1919827.1 hypothetical protein [Microcoleus sp. FACHB-831]
MTEKGYHNLTQIQIAPFFSESEANSCSEAEDSQRVYKLQAQLEPDAGVIAKQFRGRPSR